ncbi:MAG: hypothetical protein P0Y55_04470 [Candidatus Cohnella colombiensis]|uniref:Uncharacterized protein n=1 Tax=Candidatus Cohnella colombiensis TaxID=3121368 RepID=A0AA95F7I9_9BACL|nr:MAG: hypothetical protein P0Y55_04470 [Cohnella sp.]
MSDREVNEQNSIRNNQFLNPPIKSQDRSDEPQQTKHEPTIAPSMNTNNYLEENASEEEKRTGDFTEVTQLYLDRTPED